MGQIVLIAVGAAWAAVLVPPLVRARADNRPNSSVTDFRRQLSTLQRTMPTRAVSPVRSMARPLAPSALERSGRVRYPSASPVAADYEALDQPQSGGLQRRHDRDAMVGGHRHAHGRRVSRRELIRRRRANVLFALVTATLLTLFLAATMQSSLMLYLFAATFVSLCGYVYKLAQIRQYGQSGPSYGSDWFRAA